LVRGLPLTGVSSGLVSRLGSATGRRDSDPDDSGYGTIIDGKLYVKADAIAGWRRSAGKR